MRIVWIVVEVLLASAFAAGQTSPPDPVSCAKTISFAVAEGGQPVPAFPRFSAKWIGKKHYFEGRPELCLSQIPSASTANYVVIFSSSESSFDGLTPSAHTYTSTGSLSGNLAGVSSYGGTWNYSYAGTLSRVTTNSVDLQRIDASKKLLVIHAYNQQGRQVSHYSVDSDHSREKLLEQVITDIHRDVVEPPAHKRVAAPLSVYYVNCDVDSPTPGSRFASTDPAVSPTEPEPTPRPNPIEPPATVLFSSNPAGADIYVDGSYVGKSPFTVVVARGEHVVMMRKSEFGTWQRTIQVSAAPRRVTAYLERKFLTLPPGQP
jgi:hypothetical protein